jgi:hypothetical protein
VCHFGLGVFCFNVAGGIYLVINLVYCATPMVVCFCIGVEVWSESCNKINSLVCSDRFGDNFDDFCGDHPVGN